MSTKKVETNNGDEGQQKEYDVFRDSPLRYLGYANEVGESFRYQYPKFVIPSYALAFGYCFADATTSAYDTWNDSKDTSPTPVLDSSISMMDTLIWQSLASVAIPGATINMIVRASRYAVMRSPMVLPSLVSKWFPTAVGLSSIPVIIHPIDRAVDLLMDSTFRQWSQQTNKLGITYFASAPNNNKKIQCTECCTDKHTNSTES